MTIFCVHGIHTDSRDNVTAKLAVGLRQSCDDDVFVWQYGYALALTTGITDFLNERRAEKLSRIIKPGDSILAHSNGCAIAWLLQSEYLPLDRLVLVQPALDSWRTFDNVRKVLVVHNNEDEVVGASTLGFCSAWGDMGRVGYLGGGENVEQWDSKLPPRWLPPYRGHSGIVASEANRRLWGMALGNWFRDNKE